MRQPCRRMKQLHRHLFITLGLVYILLCYLEVHVDSTNTQEYVDVEEVKEGEDSDVDKVKYDEYSDSIEDSVFPSDIQEMLDGTNEMRDDDPILLKYIKHQLIPPAMNKKQLNLSKPIHTGQARVNLLQSNYS